MILSLFLPILTKYRPFMQNTDLLPTQNSKKVCIQTQVCKYRPTLSPCHYYESRIKWYRNGILILMFYAIKIIPWEVALNSSIPINSKSQRADLYISRQKAIKLQFSFLHNFQIKWWIFSCKELFTYCIH